MIKAIVYGYSPISEKVRTLVETVYSPALKELGQEEITVVAYLNLDPDIEPRIQDQIPVINCNQCAYLRSNGMADMLLVPREHYFGANNHLRIWWTMGFDLDDVYIADKMTDAVDPENFLEPFYTCAFLPYLEFHIADHCNLNCAACEHYSGLVEKTVFPDIHALERDFRRLRQFISDIALIRILGGEPLLNPEIEAYVRMVHEIYPDSDINVVTNGLLLRNMPDSFFETLRATGGGIWISYYPPLRPVIEEIRKLLVDQKVRYGISDPVDIFTKKQIMEPGSDEHKNQYFRECFQHSCNNLYDGKIAACFLPFTTKYFNAYFHKNLPEDGAMDLYDGELTTEKLKRHLTTSFERCRYCDWPQETEWKKISQPSALEEWIKE